MKLAFNGNYVGLNPENFVTANFHCKTCGNAFSSNQGIHIFCPSCGNNASMVGKIKATAITAKHLTDCGICSSEIYSDVTILPKASFCPECGDELAISEEDMDTDTEDLEDVEVVDELDEDEGFEDEGIMEAEDSEEEDSEEEDSEEEDSEEEDSEEEDSDEEDSEEEEDSEDSDDAEIEDSDDAEIEDEDESDEEEASAMVKAINEIMDKPIQKPEDVSMDLWEGTTGSVRNVIISGIPVAQIHLSDQDKPDETGRIFPDKVYEESVTENMLTTPVKEVLQSVKARFFTLTTSKEVPIEKEVKAEVEKQMTNFRSKFKKTYVSVCAGMAKNLFPDMENSLKDKLWTAMVSEGIANPSAIIEPIIEETSGPMVDQIFDKTMELLNKPDDVREAVLQMVVTAGVSSNYDEDIKSRLVQGSVKVAVVGGGKGGKRNEVRQRISFRK